ncbi:MAG: sce7726 family protein [Bacilli bacterium]|jgi:hypothetical protein|nr:sce7726 family protein [Sulfurimonas sp.]
MELLFDTIFNKKDLENKTRVFFDSLISNQSGLADVFSDQYGISYKVVFGHKDYKIALYDLLKKYYKNEYLIKRCFVKHNLLSSSATTFSEFPINNSRIDIASINGKSVAYEIKTQYDKLSRLKKQIGDYSLCFEYVYVICENSKTKFVLEKIPQYCGIYEYAGEKSRCSFKKIRDAVRSPNLSPEQMLDVLQSGELAESFGTNDKHLILETQTLGTINSHFKVCLKKRFSLKWNELKAECKAL